MIDLVTIHVQAGHGGSGAVSFATTRGRSTAPPDGGDGGMGGSIMLVADPNYNTLLSYRYLKQFTAPDGERGGRNRRVGKSSADMYLRVPAGTMVREAKAGSLQGEAGKVLGDLTTAGQTLLVARGGRGGRGNEHMKPRKTGPSTDWELYRRVEAGEAGEERELTLELKLLADVGLIGLPNAGKSTLLSVLTSATPKVAPYPFTTLEPNLGVWQLGKGLPQTLVLADIPGLLEGAAQGKGLGHEFLRHVERTNMLLHLVSIDSLDCMKDYKIINKELQTYHPDLVKKPQLVVLSKTDLADTKTARKVRRQFHKEGIRTLAISAQTHQGLLQLRRAVVAQFQIAQEE